MNTKERGAMDLSTKVRLATGSLLTLVALAIGFTLLGEEPRLGGLLLAFGALRGALVARQLWGEWSNTGLGG